MGEVEIASSTDLKTGAPMLPVIGGNLRAIILDVITACSVAVNEYASGMEASKHLEALRDRLSAKRLHQFRIDLSENANDDPSL